MRTIKINLNHIIKLALFMALLLLIPAQAFAQYSVLHNGRSAQIYNISGSRTTMPAYFRISKDKTEFSIDIARDGRQSFTLTFENRVDGWHVNNNLLGFAFDTLAFAFDFTRGIAYVLPDDISTRIVATLTPSDRISVANVSTNNPANQDIQILLLDASVLRREQLGNYFALVSPEGVSATANLPQFVPEARETVSVPGNTTGVIIRDRPVITAAANGQKDLLKRLLSEGASINEIETDTGDNALFKTIMADDEETADILLNNGINVNHKNRYGQSALHLASGRGLFNTAQRLLAAGLNPNDKDNGGNSALTYAAQSPNSRFVELLLGRGARIDDVNNNGSTPLAMAAYAGNTRNADLLLNFGANPASVDNNGNTVFMEAIKGNNQFIINRLLEHPRVDTERADNYGNTPLHMSILMGNDNVSQTLISRSSNINSQNNAGRTPLMLAASVGNNNIVQQLLDKNADIFLTDNEGRNALAMAPGAGSPVNRSLTDALKRIDEMSTELFGRVAANDIPSVRLLLNRGAKPNTSDIESGNTPMFAAVANNYRDMTKLLIEHGANPNWQNRQGNTPLILAVSTGDLRMLDILLQSGVQPNAQNLHGDTALIWAAKLHRLDAVQALLMAGANPNIRNYEGISPLAVAVGENVPDIEKMLRSFGAF